MAIEFRYPTSDDISNLVRDISPEDEKEIRALGLDPEFAIKHSIEHSLQVVAILKDNTLACIVGISQETELVELISPWLISTPFMRKHPRKVLEFSRRILREWLAHHPYLVNYVDARHLRAIAWLRHIGATIHPPEPYGAYSRPFHKFTFGEL